MLIWVAATRFPAIAKLGGKLPGFPHGGRGQDLEAHLPSKVSWKAHNFAHLMESPTLFYAVIAILAISQKSDRLDIQLAWAYVGLRIVHSLWQALVNQVYVRLGLFLLSSFILIALAIRAFIATL